MDRKAEVLKKLSVIIDPDLGKDIVSLGFIKKLRISEDGAVSFEIELTTPACPVKEQFRTQAEVAVRALPWVCSVSVSLSAQTSKGASALKAVSEGLKKVRHIVAVASCKGGVGKSTVAVNLAYSLSRQGASVGIFDADIYGPSLSTMVDVGDQTLTGQGNFVNPLIYEDVRLMSIGYVQNESGEKGPAIMRGPMVSQVLNQLLTQTDWGDLDYLILDFPPGTGDIQLTLCQLLAVTAAVIVTTPQKISFVDVVKGIQMFDSLQVPTVAVVENMSYFLCESCSHKHTLFGAGAGKQLGDEFGFEHVIALPMTTDVSTYGDGGGPLVVAAPDSPVSKQFAALSETVVREISKVMFGGQEKPTVVYEKETGIVFREKGAVSVTVSPYTLRLACRCAYCIDEMSGQKTLDPDTVTRDVVPESIEPMGNYAIRVAWSDGHSSIFPYKIFAQWATW